MSYLMRTLLILALGVVPIALMGCPANDDDDDASDDDDSAAGDDDDTTPPLPTSLVATVEYNDTVDGVPACDMTVDIVGNKYTGGCNGCDFAFETEATLTDDQSTDACDQVDYWSWYYDGGMYVPWMMAHWDSYQSYYGTYTNVFRAGVAIDYSAYGGSYYLGPYYATLHFDGTESDSTFTRTGDDIEWTFNTSSQSYLGNYANDCGIGYGSYADSAYAGDFEMTDDVACDAASADVWTFTAIAGATYSITVDTVSAATAFDPTFHINDPSGCYLVGADDSFDCTFPPPTFSCPSFEMASAEEGTYQVVVYENTYDTSECVDGTIGEYVIRVDALEDPMLTLLHDDIATYAEKATNVVLTGTITP